MSAVVHGILEVKAQRLRRHANAALKSVRSTTAKERRELRAIALLFKELTRSGLNESDLKAAGEKLITQREALLTKMAARRGSADSPNAEGGSK